MGFEFYKEAYTGNVKEITLGEGAKALTVGGENCYPFYQFEGDMPRKPKIAMEIWDMAPEDWPDAALSPFEDVVSDPAAWAKKCAEQYGAEMIVLQLKSIDPNGADASPEDAAATVKKVAEAIDVPLVVWGCANPQKDEDVLKKIAEECQDQTLILGPVEEKNHKGIGAAAMGFGHALISSSPIDVNLAKQVNILLENLGMPLDRVIIDPTSGGLGYGLEYTYSVMERLRQAALTQNDDKLQLPIINNLANEVWKCKEAKQTSDEAPELGDPERRGILMEAVCAVSYLMSGSNLLVMRHPEAIRLTKAFIELMADGGSAEDVAAIAKSLADAEVDYAAIAPEPDLAIAEEKAAAPAKKEAPAKPKAEAPPAEAKPAAAPEAKPAPEPEAPAAPAVDAAAEAKAAEEAQAKAEADAKAKAEADAKAKAEAEAKAKAEAEAKAQAEAEAKAQAEADAKAKAEAEAKAKQEADEQAIRDKRAKEREAVRAKRAPVPVEEEVPKTAAVEQKTDLEKMLNQLDRIHRRNA